MASTTVRAWYSSSPTQTLWMPPGSLESSTLVGQVGDEARAEVLGLVAHLLHQLGALDAAGREAGVVLDLGGLLEQAAPEEALDDQRAEVRACRVQGGRVPGRAAAHDDHVLDVRHRITLAFGAHFTLYSSSPPAIRYACATAVAPWPPVLLAPRGDAPAQLEIGDRAGQGRQPEGERAVGQDGADRVVRRDAEGREGADHAAVDSADAARQRQRVAQHARRSRRAR